MGAASRLVLCVEDDPDTQEMLGLLARQRGYAFKAVGTRAAALRAMWEEVAVILLDNVLPDGNGIALCRQIRQFNRQAPIIFLSGAAQESERAEALRAGASAFLTKPVQLHELFAALAEHAPLP